MYIRDVYIRGVEVEIRINNGNPAPENINIESVNMRYDVDDENDSFNTSIGGELIVNVRSDTPLINVESVDVYYNNENTRWFQGFFVTEEESVTLDEYVPQKLYTYRFGDALANAQNGSLRKLCKDNSNNRFTSFNGLIEQITGVTNKEIRSDVLINGVTPDLADLDADIRAFYDADLNNREVLENLANCFAARMMHTNDTIYIHKPDVLANNSGIIQIGAGPQLLRDGEEVKADHYKYQIVFDKTRAENLALNNELICGNNDGTDLYSIFTNPVQDNLTQRASGPNEPSTLAKWATNGYRLFAPNGTAGFPFNQSIEYNWNFKLPVNSDFNVLTRVVYVDEFANQWALDPSSNWSFMGQSLSDPTSPAFDNFPISDNKTFFAGDGVFDQDTGRYDFSHSFTKTNLADPPGAAFGAYYIWLRATLVGAAIGNPSFATLTEIGFNILRPGRPSNDDIIFDTFEEKNIKDYNLILGASSDIFFTNDAQTINGVLLYQNDLVNTSTAVRNALEANTVDDYINLEIITNQKISPINFVRYNSQNYFIQSIDYDFNTGICKLVIKRCRA